jgi:hypothetical protein
MNIEKLTTVYNWLAAGAPEAEADGLRFNMRQFIDGDIASQMKDPENWCGTSCCIAGFVAVKELPGQSHSEIMIRAETVAEKALGLNPDQAHDLFYAWPRPDWLAFEDITPSQAAGVVKTLIETGRVRWDLVEESEGAL